MESMNILFNMEMEKIPENLTEMIPPGLIRIFFQKFIQMRSLKQTHA